jgi:beta-lactamase regulating signal transducer with metallopeptidase domain
MSSVFLWLTTYVANAVWQVPLMGAAGWGLSRWLRRTGPEFQHKLWVAVLMLATLVPATPVFQQYFAHETPASTMLVSARPRLTAVLPGHVSLTTPFIVLPPAAIYVVSGLYIAAVLFFLLRLCWLIRCTSALVRNAGPASLEPDYLAMWNRSKVSFSVQTASLLRSHDVPGPVTAGFWRPVLLLPATFTVEHSPTEFLAAIGHECAHIQRNDFYKNLLYEVIALVTTFHPVTWFIKSHIAQTREMVCDRMAAEQLLDRRAYGQSLLQLATRMPRAAPSAVFHTVGMFDTNILERRIMTIMTALPRVSRIRRYLLGVSATVLLSLCAGVSGWFTQPVAAQTSNPSAQADTRGKNQQASKDLSCTYWDNKDTSSPGTCGVDKQDKTKYRCYSDQDRSKSQEQIGCEWKVRRAAEAKK